MPDYAPSSGTPPGPTGPEGGVTPARCADPPGAGPVPRPAARVAPAARLGRWEKSSRIATRPPALPTTPPGPLRAKSVDPPPAGRLSGSPGPSREPGWPSARPPVAREWSRGIDDGSDEPS